MSSNKGILIFLVVSAALVYSRGLCRLFTGIAVKAQPELKQLTPISFDPKTIGVGIAFTFPPEGQNKVTNGLL